MRVQLEGSALPDRDLRPVYHKHLSDDFTAGEVDKKTAQMVGFEPCRLCFPEAHL